MRITLIVLALLFGAALSADEILTRTFDVRVLNPDGTNAGTGPRAKDLHFEIEADGRWGCASDAGWQAFQKQHPNLPGVHPRFTATEDLGDGVYRLQVEVTLKGNDLPKDAVGKVYAPCRILARIDQSNEGVAPVEVSTGDAAELSIRLRRYAVVDYLVTFDGAAREGVSCTLRSTRYDAAGGDLPLAELTSDARGRIFRRFDEDQGGRYHLILSGDGWVFDDGSVQRIINLVPGKRSTDATGELRVVRAGAISGRVTGADGKPIRAIVDASTSIDGSEQKRLGVCGEGGRFTISNLLPLKYEVRVWKSGYQDLIAGSWQVKAGETVDVGDVSLDPTKYVAVGVRGWNGLLRLDVELEITPRPPGFGEDFALLDEENKLYLLKLRPGKYTIKAIPPDGPHVSVGVEFDKLPHALEIQLPYQPLLQFHVRSSRASVRRYDAWLFPEDSDAYEKLKREGPEAIGKRIDLEDADEIEGMIYWEDPRHRVGKPPLPINEGKYAVLLRGEMRDWVMREITIIYIDSVQTFEVPDPGMKISITVTEGGRPAANQALVVLGEADRLTRDVVTDDQGQVRLWDVWSRSGRETFHVLRKSEESWLQMLELNQKHPWFMQTRKVETKGELEVEVEISLDLPTYAEALFDFENLPDRGSIRLELQPLFDNLHPLTSQWLRFRDEKKLRCSTGPLPTGRYRARVELMMSGVRDNPHFVREFDFSKTHKQLIDWDVALHELSVTMSGEHDQKRVVIGLTGPLGDSNYATRKVYDIEKYDGVATFSGLPPGRYYAWSAQSSPAWPTEQEACAYKLIELPRDNHEVTLEFPQNSGRLFVWADHNENQRYGELVFRLYNSNGVEVPVFPTWPASIRGRDAMVPSLAPGQYTLKYGGPYWIEATTEPFEIKAGEVTTLRIAPEAAPTVDFVFKYKDQAIAAMAKELTVEYLDAEGRVVGATGDFGYETRLSVRHSRDGPSRIQVGLIWTQTRKLRLRIEGIKDMEFEIEPGMDSYTFGIELEAAD